MRPLFPPLAPETGTARRNRRCSGQQRNGDLMATLDRKLTNPADVYAAPADVLVDDHLDYDEKVRVLAAWRQDAERLSDSANEGMTGGENARLREVALAQKQLETLGST